MDTPEPIRWGDLTDRQRAAYLRAAEQIADRESKRLRKRFGKNVLSIAPAFRIKGRAKRVRRELVLRVTVQTKWGPDHELPKGEERIPPYFERRQRHGRGYRVIRIPTDVEEVPELELHDRTHVIVQIGTSEPDEFGSICCLVEDADGALYMLSCNHVFGRMKCTRKCKGSTRAKIDQHDPDCESIASVRFRRNIAAMHAGSAKRSLDAALARVNFPDSASSTINNRRARSVLFDTDRIKIGVELSIPAKSKAIRAEIEAVHRNGFPITIKCDGRREKFMFKRVIEYKTRPKIIGGDSGSPVLTDRDELAGMHFAGRPAQSRGFAMFAADIFRDSTFDRPIKLKTDHNP